MRYHGITLIDIEYFTAVYEQRSMSQAAELLFTSRQAIARSIDKLEKVIGHPLFIRNSAGMFPTDFCHDFYAQAMIVLEETRKLIAMSESYKGSNNPITIGMLGPYRMGLVLESLFSEFIADHPEIQIKVSHFGWPDLVEAVEKRTIDCAYTAILPGMMGDRFQCYPLISQKHLLMVRKEAGVTGPVHTSELQDKQIVLNTRFNIQSQMLGEYAQKHDLHFKEPITTSDLFFAEGYIGQDEYAVVLEEFTADKITGSGSQYVKVELTPPIIRQSGLIFLKEFTIRDEHIELIKFLSENIG